MTATWSSIVRQVQGRHRFARRDGRELRLVLAVGAAPPTRVGLCIRQMMEDADAAIEITADLGTMTRIDPLAGLRVNTRLSHGALALQDEILVLRAVVPLATLTDDDLERRLQQVAAEAAELKREMAAAPYVAEAFGHHAG